MVLCCVQPGGQVTVSGQRAASLKKKIKPQFRKNLSYKGLLWLISFLVCFLLEMIQVGNMALPVSYRPFSSPDVDKVVTMRARLKAQDRCSLCCLCLLLPRFPDGGGPFPTYPHPRTTSKPHTLLWFS